MAQWPQRIMRATRFMLERDSVVFGALALLLAVSLVVQLSAMVIPDIGWFLHSAARYLEGGELYRDTFLGMNPPLVIFLNLPAVSLARLTGLFSIHVFVVYVHFLIILSMSATWWLLRNDRHVSPVMRRGILVLGFVILTICPGNQFGQREHLLILLALPYLVMVARQMAGASTHWPTAFAFGFAAGVGFAIKPYFLLVPFALEIYRAAVTRRPLEIFRPETWGLGIAWFFYGATLVFITPEYLARILPYALEVYNHSYKNPLWINLWRIETVMLPVGCIVQVATRRSQKTPHLGDVFMIASACLFATYVYQAKGWDYHLYPTSVCLILGYGAIILNCLDTPLEDPTPVDNASLTQGIAVASLALIAMLVASDALRLGYKSPFTQIARPYVERYASGGAVAIFGSNVWPGFPLVNYTGVTWSSRFPMLWILPGVIRKRHIGETENAALLDEMEAFTRDTVVADFTANMPDLVIVDDQRVKQYFAPAPFDYLAFFNEDPRFARLWSEYVWVGREVDFDFYRRRCAPGCGFL